MRALARNWQLGLLLAALVGCEGGTEAPRPSQLRQPVIGGALDTADHNVVAIFIQPVLSTGVGFCTGFLVAPNLVMTARHCVSGMDKAQVVCADEVVQGVTYTAVRALAPQPASQFTISDVADVYAAIPPMFAVAAVHVPADVAGLPNCGHDVALLELAAPLAGATSLALRADLPSTSETFTATGYGYDGAVVNSDGVRRTRSGLGIFAVGELRGTSGRIAATTNDWVATLGPCGGDSGAPALDAQGKVIGVMSRGNPTVCQQMIYTQVAPFREWVKQIARDAAMRGGIPLVDWVAAEPALDAGNPDAGPAIDAGQADAGGLDAGEVDAGLPDAGPDLEVPRLGVISQPPAAVGCSTAGSALGLLGLVFLAITASSRRAAVREAGAGRHR